MRRAPAKPMRAYTLRNWCLVSHVTFQAPRHTSHLTVLTLHTTHFTLHSSHCTLRSQHFTSHCTLRTPNFTLHSPHFTVHTSHFSLLTASFTLHTALFTPHTSHCTLHTPHFISSELFSPYPSLALLISSLLICHLSFHESLPSTTTKELACTVRQPGLCVRALCEAVAVLLSKNMTCARPGYNANTFLKLHIALCTPHTPHFTLALHLNSSHLSSFHLIPCLPICQLSSSSNCASYGTSIPCPTVHKVIEILIQENPQVIQRNLSPNKKVGSVMIHEFVTSNNSPRIHQKLNNSPICTRVAIYEL